MNVGVTAVGGGIGQSVIKALSRTRYRTVAIDPSPDAAGLYMADYGVIGKDVNDKSFIKTLVDICKKQNCKYLFPGLDAELMPISRNSDKFRSNGITPIISPPEIITLSDNKWELRNFLAKHKFPYIPSALTVEEALSLKIPFPWIMKPVDGGCRSKNVYTVKNTSEARCLEQDTVKYIIQEFIDGDEYTCGSVTFNKKVLGTILMKRTLRNGDTYKAYVESNPTITLFLNDVLSKINPFGPCNVQLRMRDGIPYILEINARCSGTTAARALAGFNEPEIICDYLSGEKPDYRIREVAILRYWNECVVEYDRIKEIKDEGIIHRSNGSPWPKAL